MDKDELRALQDKCGASLQIIRKVEQQVEQLLKIETDIMTQVQDSLDFARPLQRQIGTLQGVLNQVKSHSFARLVQRQIPRWQSEAQRVEELDVEVKDAVMDSRVRVGDAEMTLQTLLNSLNRND